MWNITGPPDLTLYEVTLVMLVVSLYRIRNFQYIQCTTARQGHRVWNVTGPPDLTLCKVTDIGCFWKTPAQLHMQSFAPPKQSGRSYMGRVRVLSAVDRLS